jgi:phosphoribosylformylglycinamidine synthase subunit PurL
LDAVAIGKVVEGNQLKIYHNGNLEADLPVDKLTDEAPKYNRPLQNPKSQDEDQRPKTQNPKPKTQDPNEILKMLLASPNICSKSWVYSQYDQMVRTNTAVLPGADAAVVRVKETRRAIAMCLDGNARFIAVNPKEGAKLNVVEAARNVVCVGAKPIAITNCLNFASPERPEVMWSFSEVIDGMREACEAFETPVVSGNVSFYNETEGRGILPTPTIGMVGLIEDTRKIITQGFKDEGDLIALLGLTNDDLAGTEYAQTVLGFSTDALVAIGEVPKLNLDLEKRVQETCLKLADSYLLKSAHDCADGGLAAAIAESCFSSLKRKKVGAKIELKNENLSNEALLFGESPSRIVVSFAAENLDKIQAAAVEMNCPLAVIGKVGGGNLTITVNKSEIISAPIAELENVWANSLEKQLGEK